VRNRFGGALATAVTEGVDLPRKFWIDVGDDAPRRARELLSRKDRPEGVISLWREEALAVKKAADELGLKLGRDLELVGWCPEELYERQWRAEFGRTRPAPAVSWSMRTLAETALTRLIERRENPHLPALKVSVPVRLRLAGE
jgi:DNA-binding LacI/PurR family transcriptional regulator